eukprot:1343511-Prymnesium_polylepis.1
MAAMPDLRALPAQERTLAMAAWLQHNRVPYDMDAGDEGVRSAWKQVKASMKESAHQPSTERSILYCAPRSVPHRGPCSASAWIRASSSLSTCFS